MRHHTLSGSGKQVSLAISPMAIAERGFPLHLAYGRLEPWRQPNFEQVMAKRVIAIGVRNMADAITRRGCCGKTEHEHPRSDATSMHADPRTESRTGITRKSPGRTTIIARRARTDAALGAIDVAILADY